jgi:hypothetical protein
MKKLVLFIITALFLLSCMATSAFALSGQEILESPITDYAGIIGLVCATVGVIAYVVYTYLKK